MVRGRRRATPAALALTAAFGGLLSCRQIVGIKDDPPTELSPSTNTSTSACGLPYGTGACASCAQSKCCADSSACAASQPCSSYETCLSACSGDPQCRSQCTVDHRLSTGTSPELSKLSACLAANCSGACALTCGAVAEYVSPPAVAQQCETCLAMNGACDQATSCGSSADCDAYLRCLVACPTLDCREVCSTSNAAGYALYGAVEKVRSGACAATCKYGDNWTCVGHVSPPRPLSSTTTLEFRSIYDRGAMNAKLISGATVSVCGGGPSSPLDVGFDSSCSAPVARATTDTNGDATLVIPTALASSVDGSGLNGFGRVDATGYPPTFFYWGFPLSQSTLVIGQPVTPSVFTDSPSFAPGTGNAWVGVLDCLDSLAGGVNVRTGTGVEAEYFRGTPQANATLGTLGPGSAATGVGEFQNLTAGLYTFTATPIELGKPSSTVTAYVAEGAVTIIAMLPTQ